MIFLTAFLCFFAGAITASFIGVIVERMHTGQSWMHGRSRCNSCRAFLDGRDLVPVLSWLWYRGRCRQCGSRIPAQYVLVEVALGSLFALSYFYLGLGMPLLLLFLILGILTFTVLYDLRHTVVPTSASTLLLLACTVFAVITARSVSDLGITFLTAGCIALGFFLLHVGSRGRAMGLGDAPIALALSLLVASRALSGLLFSFWIGALFGIILLSVRRGGPRMGIEVPFVPFLAIGYLLAFFTTWNPLYLFAG